MQISRWEITKADILYYKGDILTLWMYLSELFAPHDNELLLSPSTLSSTPGLAHLLLRHLECGFLIRKMSSPKVKAGIDIDDLLTKLDHVLDASKLHAEHRTRAIAFRVTEQGHWLPDRVESPNGGPASEGLKQNSIRQCQEAINIHEEFATPNGASLQFVYAMVKRSLGYSNTSEIWDVACHELPLLDRDDLYFSMKSLTQRLFKAVVSRDVNGLRMSLPALNETLSLGEWGKMFYDKWWRAEEAKLVKTDLWRRACEGETPFIPNMRTPVTRKPVRQESVQIQSTAAPIFIPQQSQRHSSFGSELAKQATSAFVQAVVTDAVNDANQALGGASNSNNNYNYY